jgi:hypothetical protein
VTLAKNASAASAVGHAYGEHVSQAEHKESGQLFQLLVDCERHKQSSLNAKVKHLLYHLAKISFCSSCCTKPIDSACRRRALPAIDHDPYARRAVFWSISTDGPKTRPVWNLGSGSITGKV